ncbi:MAG: LPS export ABC transporter periplasmic protein LptC [Roseiarcus sp.]
MALQRQESGLWRERAEDAARSARAFRAAKRHSALVRGLEVLLLVGSVGAVAVVIALTLLHTLFAHARGLSFARMFTDGSKITMDKPKLTGVRSDGGAYVLTADRALQDIKSPNQVDLVELHGDIGSRDRPPMKLAALKGHYDSAQEVMDLVGHVRLVSADYTVETEGARIDFKAGVYESDRAIEVVMAGGVTILADGAIATDNGAVMTFSGHVRTHVPGAGDAPAAAAEMKGVQR